MSVDSENSCVLLSSRDSRTSCFFQTADEKDEIPGMGDESILEMLSYSKFSDLETWLCMPSSLLLPRNLDLSHLSSSSSNLSSSHASNHLSNSPPMSSSSSLASNSRPSTCSEPAEPDRMGEGDPAGPDGMHAAGYVMKVMCLLLLSVEDFYMIGFMITGFLLVGVCGFLVSRKFWKICDGLRRATSTRIHA